MTTEIVKRQDIPTPTPQHDRSLSPQGLADHRAKIASEVKIVLSAYFQPHESDEVKAGQLSWWCDELQEWTREQIVWALRQWNRENPRLRPTPGDIVSICKKARGRKIAARMQKPEPEPERKPVDAETASRILAEAGFNPKRMQADE